MPFCFSHAHRSFLSTLSLRRATWQTAKAFDGLCISIHALLAESDTCAPVWVSVTIVFLSTLSLRRATLTEINKMATGQISIHALLAESDTAFQKLMAALLQFLSTLSLRRATSGRLSLNGIRTFLSTLSLRRATHILRNGSHSFHISIHALLAESDSKSAQNSGVLLRI